MYFSSDPRTRIEFEEWPISSRNPAQYRDLNRNSVEANLALHKVQSHFGVVIGLWNILDGKSALFNTFQIGVNWMEIALSECIQEAELNDQDKVSVGSTVYIQILHLQPNLWPLRCRSLFETGSTQRTFVVLFRLAFSSLSLLWWSQLCCHWDQGDRQTSSSFFLLFLNAETPLNHSISDQICD